MKLVSTVVVIVSDSMHYLIVCLNSHCIVVHRLEMYRQRYLNNYSIVFFHVDSGTWTKPSVQGIPPLPRSLHSATVIGSRLVSVM